MHIHGFYLTKMEPDTCIKQGNCKMNHVSAKWYYNESISEGKFLTCFKTFPFWQPLVQRKRPGFVTQTGFVTSETLPVVPH